MSHRTLKQFRRTCDHWNVVAKQLSSYVCVGILPSPTELRWFCFSLIDHLKLIGCCDFHLKLDIRCSARRGAFSLTSAMVRVASRALVPFIQKRVFCGVSSEVGTLSHWLVGQRLDTKSNLCPISVKALSNVCPITGKVQGLSSQVQDLSNGCLESVEFLSNSKVLGQSSDMEIQELSRHCPIKLSESAVSEFELGQTLDVDHICRL